MELRKLAADFEIDENTMHVLQIVIEQERREMRRRQAEGIARAKARGVHFGRPRTEVRGLERAYELYAKNQISVTEAAKLCGVPRSTMYRRLCEYDKQKRIG